MAKRFVDLIGLQSCTGFNIPNWTSGIGESNTPNYVQGTNLMNLTQEYNVPVTVVNTDKLLIQFEKSNSSSFSIAGWYKNNGQQTQILSVTTGWDPMPYLGLAVVVDDDTQQGGFWYCSNYVYYGSNKYYGSNNGHNQGTNISYLAIVGSLQPTYTWQSVSSISGKNGILTLSTLNDVNDGEPVETSDTSKFNLTDDSNVSALVAAHFSE